MKKIGLILASFFLGLGIQTPVFATGMESPRYRTEQRKKLLEVLTEKKETAPETEKKLNTFQNPKARVINKTAKVEMQKKDWEYLAQISKEKDTKKEKSSPTKETRKKEKKDLPKDTVLFKKSHSALETVLKGKTDAIKERKQIEEYEIAKEKMMKSKKREEEKGSTYKFSKVK